MGKRLLGGFAAAAVAMVLTVACAGSTAPVSARSVPARGVVALAPDALFDAGPALAGDRVLYGTVAGKRITLSAAPLSGGPVTSLPSLLAPHPILGWYLAADAQGLAADVALSLSQDTSGSELFMGPLGLTPRPVPGPFSLYGGNPPDGFFAAGADAVAVESKGHRLVVHSPTGASRQIALPRGAAVSVATVTGDLIALPVYHHHRDTIEVIDRRTRKIIRAVPLPDTADSLGVGPDGSVAVVGDSDLLWYSAAGTSSFSEINAQAAVVGPVVRDGEIAYVESPIDDNQALLARPVVISAPGQARNHLYSPHYLFQGPTTSYVRSLDFDGHHIAWSTTTCQMLAAVPGPTTDVIPAGPCIRAEINTDTYGQTVVIKGVTSLPFGVTCATATARGCRVTVRLYGGTTGGTLLGTEHAVVRARSVHTFHFPLGPHALASFNQSPIGASAEVTLTDGYGHSYVEFVA